MDAATRAMVIEVCEQCSRPFERPTGRRAITCRDCRMRNATDAMRQLNDREGPFYEKAVRSNFEHWRDEARRLGINVK